MEAMVHYVKAGVPRWRHNVLQEVTFISFPMFSKHFSQAEQGLGATHQMMSASFGEIDEFIKLAMTDLEAHLSRCLAYTLLQALTTPLKYPLISSIS